MKITTAFKRWIEDGTHVNHICPVVKSLGIPQDVHGNIIIEWAMEAKPYFDPENPTYAVTTFRWVGRDKKGDERINFMTLHDCSKHFDGLPDDPNYPLSRNDGHGYFNHQNNRWEYDHVMSKAWRLER